MCKFIGICHFFNLRWHKYVTFYSANAMIRCALFNNLLYRTSVWYPVSHYVYNTNSTIYSYWVSVVHQNMPVYITKMNDYFSVAHSCFTNWWIEWIENCSPSDYKHITSCLQYWNKNISTQFPDGQNSRGLISIASMTRIMANLQWESLLEVSGFQDIWLEMLGSFFFRWLNGDAILFYFPHVNNFLTSLSVASSTCVQDNFFIINWAFTLRINPRLMFLVICTAAAMPELGECLALVSHCNFNGQERNMHQWHLTAETLY